MTTFFMDPLGGNDANNGTTFALRWKSTSGTGFSSIAAGDSVRVIKSGDKRDSSVVATWPALPSLADIEPVTVTSISNTTPIVVTTSAPHNKVDGQYIALRGNSMTRANAVWEITAASGSTLTLVNSEAVGAGTGGTLVGVTGAVVEAALPIKNICLPFSGKENVTLWTPSTNVTVAAGSTVTASGRHVLTVAAGFTTGKAAYTTLPAALNLSGFKGISLLVKTSVAFTLNLCTDTLGATAVHTIAVPALNGTYTRVVNWDNGAALNAAIASVSISFASDPGAVSFTISNIVAVKGVSDADFVSHSTLLSNGVNSEALYPTMGLYENKAVLGIFDDTHTTFEAITYYQGSVSSSNLFFTTPLTLPVAYSGGSTVNLVGAPELPITISGGWNTTDMSTKTGVSILDGRSTQGNFAPIKLGSSASFIVLQDYMFVDPNVTFNFDGKGNKLQCTQTFSSAVTGLSFKGFSCLAEIDYILGAITGIDISGSKNIIRSRNQSILRIFGSYTGAYSSYAKIGTRVYNTHIKYSYTNIAAPSFGLILYNCIISHSIAMGISMYGSWIKMVGGQVSDAGTGYKPVDLREGLLEINGTTIDLDNSIDYFDSIPSNAGDLIYTKANGNTSSNGKRSYGRHCYSSTTLRRGGEGLGWVLAPTATVCNEAAPVTLNLAKVAVSAGTLVTAKVWVMRSNTGITTVFKTNEGLVAGDAATPVFASAAADIWEELTITFTPTEVGVVELLVEAYGGTTYYAVADDVSVSQA